MLNLAMLFLLLFFIWIVFIGTLTTPYLIAGALSCLIVVVFYRLIYKDKIKGLFLICFRMCRYCVWLGGEIAKSAFNLSLKMWHLDADISPQLLWINVNARDDITMTVFASSITLTPGTVAIGTHNGKVYVHSLTKHCMENLQSGKMLENVCRATKIGKK